MASANQKLQQWLLEIEKGLIDLAPGDRAKIIFDLDTQIRTQLTGDAANDDAKIDGILSALGPTNNVIAKARMDRGLDAVPPSTRNSVPPTRPAKSPSKFLKWATIILVGGFFSFLALIIVVPILVMKFVSSSGFHKSFNISTFGGDESDYHIKGSQNASGLEHLILRATNANVVLTAGKSGFSYDCTLKGEQVAGENPLSYPDDSTVAMNFDDLSANDGVECKFEVSKDISADLTLVNGNVTATNLSKDIKITVDNGKITFSKEPSVLFLVNASASVGQIQGLDDFNQEQVSMKADAPHARADLKVNAGQIIIAK